MNTKSYHDLEQIIQAGSPFVISLCGLTKGLLHMFLEKNATTEGYLGAMITSYPTVCLNHLRFTRVLSAHLVPIVSLDQTTILAMKRGEGGSGSSYVYFIHLFILLLFSYFGRGAEIGILMYMPYTENNK